MNIPDHISESLETILGLKILKFFDADPGSEILLTLDPGRKNSVVGGLDIFPVPEPSPYVTKRGSRFV
jgi:hypothetical protein